MLFSRPLHGGFSVISFSARKLMTYSWFNAAYRSNPSLTLRFEKHQNTVDFFGSVLATLLQEIDHWTLYKDTARLPRNGKQDFTASRKELWTTGVTSSKFFRNAVRNLSNPTSVNSHGEEIRCALRNRSFCDLYEHSHENGLDSSGAISKSMRRYFYSLIALWYPQHPPLLDLRQSPINITFLRLSAILVNSTSRFDVAVFVYYPRFFKHKSTRSSCPCNHLPNSFSPSILARLLKRTKSKISLTSACQDWEKRLDMLSTRKLCCISAAGESESPYQLQLWRASRLPIAASSSYSKLLANSSKNDVRTGRSFLHAGISSSSVIRSTFINLWRTGNFWGTRGFVDVTHASEQAWYHWRI